ncbi:hypothetical protein F4779DRAFT_581873 [Xylariaceae sp. FL0662B]|nr:hypothetical protein F4779DRAFT_581873 [Xylariaceae sp. FL0662B]
MESLESRQKMREWRIIWQRGHSKTQKASRDKVARCKLLADNPPQKPEVFRLNDPDIKPAVIAVPAFLLETNAADHEPNHTSRKSRYAFLTGFPSEIRNMIYRFAVDYPTSRTLYNSYYQSGHVKPTLRTPTILLLCKQITREALSLLHLQPLVIDRMPPWIMGDPAPLALTNFIGRSTLQNLRFVVVKITLGENTNLISGSLWYRVLKHVLDVWSERNSLVRVEIMFKLANVNCAIWNSELVEYDRLVKMFRYFEFKYGSKPDLLRWEHWVLDYPYAYRVGYRNPLIRTHPDPYIWQGGIIEFI